MWSVYSWNSVSGWWDWMQDFTCESEALRYATEMNRNWFKTKVFYEPDLIAA
jgi:hypothetical protein